MAVSFGRIRGIVLFSRLELQYKNLNKHMGDDSIISAPSKEFESIKKIDEGGVEYWEARELMPHLGYAQWRNFEEVIKKAIKACINSAQEPKDHFASISKVIEVGKGV